MSTIGPHSARVIASRRAVNAGHPRPAAPGSAPRSAPPPGIACGRRAPLGRTPRIPTMRTGSTWRPVCRASSPMPGWNGLMSPVMVRVPSGNRTTCQPACSRPFGRGDRVRAAPSAVEREGAQPGGDQPARPLRGEVVGGSRRGEPLAVLRAEGETERGEVEVAGVGGADEGRPFERGKVLPADDPRTHQEPADERADEPRRDLARDDRGARELPACRGRGPAGALGRDGGRLARGCSSLGWRPVIAGAILRVRWVGVETVSREAKPDSRARCPLRRRLSPRRG